MKITDAIQEFILYKQSLGMSYKNRALKLNAFARCAGPVEIDSVAPETVRRFLDGDRPVTTEWFNKFSALKMFYRFALSRGYATHNPLPISQPKSTGKVTFNASLWGELKHHLFRLFDGQCAYCEVKVTDVDPGSVEHYRPKGRVEEAPDHPGYYWLAYNEQNWFPACPLCNEVAKRSHFPIVPNSSRAYKQDDEGQERPMLLTPYDVDADRDFEFVLAKRGIACMIIGKTERAKETIRVCGLDRGELSISRGEQWLRAQQDFLALVLVNRSFEKAQKDFDATARHREFSSVSRAAVQRMSA